MLPLTDELLAIGSSEGCVRVWDASCDCGAQRLVTAWQATPPPAETSLRNVSLSGCWQPARVTLAAAGGIAPSVVFWDLARQQRVTELVAPLEHGASVSALCADQQSPLVVAGSSDGKVVALDPRLPPAAGVAAVMAGSREAIVALAMQGVAGGVLAAGTAGREVWLIDPRRASSSVGGNAPSSDSAALLSGAVRSFFATKESTAGQSAFAPLSALALHSSSPLAALGSRAQLIKLWELGANVREHSTFRYFEGFLGARIAPVSCLAFHPRELHLFAAGSTASVVTLYAGKGERFSRQ